ncbi:DUF4232 domain-containing protein [Streptomyces sp. RKAG290]|uniref:DUF4232 domain-containing protein n=1 Tax=Streptomyces sp. RKAG290 TaxID=2888348 RepID=UPI00203393CF|nr:DUF4232 domain-containing protein [Streptomyces sp. RKAG290]MCM2413019.1 DUF4232 domain-containing protein [Streptomyces sp. RKAG290]
MSAFRNRTTALATTTAVLALALTACGGSGTGTRSEGPANSSAPAAAKTATGTATGTSGTAKTPVTAEISGTAKVSGTSKTSATTPACTTEDLKISAAAQDGPPLTHLVLTAKNTSGHTCGLNGFPEIQFLESHKQNVPAVGSSKPATPVVLAAGAPAYALVKLSDGGADEDVEPVIAFSVTLQHGGGQAAVRAPGAEGIAVDPAKALTGYWTYELRNGADDF